MPSAAWRSGLGLTLGLLLAPALPALGAAPAEPPESIAFHPCVIVGEKSKEKAQDYESACTAEVARASVQLVPSEQIHTFLDAEPKKSCALAKLPAECLGRMALATHAVRALLITVHPGLQTRVSGLVVSEHGDVIDQKTIQIRSRGQPQEELIRTSVMRLREQLDLVPLKVPSLVEPPKPSPAPAEAQAPIVSQGPTTPAPAALEVRQEGPRRTWKTTVAYSAGGLGVVALGVAGYYAYQGEQTVLTANKKFAGPYPYPGDIATIQALDQKAQTQRIIAGVSAAAGVVLLGAGTYLWLADRPRPPQPGITALTVGPGSVGVVGVLP